jgi:hypothetical protein
MHTPGPWEVRDKFYIGRAGRMSLAEVKSGDVPAEDVEQHMANARLIAAAPDLLAACKAAAMKLAHSPLDRISVAFEMLEAAIAKATGEQHG